MTGALVQRIPLDIPPGRNGLQPDLALQYNSQNNVDSIVGYGWSLSIPYIQRLNKTGSQNLYGSNPYYTSSLEGELAVSDATSSTVYRAKIDNGDFTSYSFANNTWTVYDKHGTRYLYGASDQSRQFGSSTTTFKWMLEEIRDTNNNYVKYTYAKDSNDIYPSQITYTGHGAVDGIFTITFTKVTRPDVYISYRPGFKVTTNYRISEIDANVNGSAVRKYILSYVPGNNGVRSMLTSVQLKGFDENNVETDLPAMTFSYVSTSTQFYSPSGATMPVNGAAYVVSDTNGNGINDVNQFYFDQTSNATGSNMYIDQGSLITNVVPPEWWSYAGTPPIPQERGVRYVDVNGDGKADVARGLWDSVHALSVQKLWTNGYSTSTGYVWNSASSSSSLLTSASADWKLDESSGNASDATGNGHTLTNIGTVAYSAGKINNAADGGSSNTSKRLEATDNGAYGVTTGAMSMAAWINGTNFPGSGSLAVLFDHFYGNTTNGMEYALIYDNRSGQPCAAPMLVFMRSGASTDEACAHVSLSTGTWHHIVGTYDGSTLTLYEDGSSVATHSSTAGGTNYGSTGGVATLAAWGGGNYFSGLVDEAGIWANALTSSDVTTLYNGGAGLQYPFSTTTPTTGVVPYFEWYGTGATSTITTGLFGDVNGDGLPDYVVSLDKALSGVPQTGTYLGNGSQWDDATTTIFVGAKQLPTQAPTSTNSMLADINGDHLDDWIFSDASSTHALLNTGTGWELSPDPSWDLPFTTLTASSSSSTVFYDRGIRLMDLNGDSLTDVVRSYNVTGSGGCSSEVAAVKQVFLNTGHGFASTSAYTLPAYITTGDSTNNGCTFNEYGNWNGNGEQNQDVLSTITYPKGGSTNIAYIPTAKTGTNPGLPVSLLVVYRIETNDGYGNLSTSNYTYGGGQLYLAQGARERKFAGFATSTASLPDSSVTTYYDQGVAVQTGLGEQADGYGQINHPFRKDTFDLANTLKQRAFYRWDTTSHGSSTAVRLGRELAEFYDPAGSSHIERANDYAYSTTTNDLIQKIEYGQVLGNGDGTFSDTGTDKRTTRITYAASSTANLTAPIETTVFDNSSATSTDTKFFYDNLAFGSVNAANPTQEQDWITGSTYASSTKGYDSYGLVASSTDRKGNVTTYVNDSNNLYIATSTNPLSQSTGYQYNYSNGKLKQIYDPNGRITKNIFDGLGRLTETDQSDLDSPTATVPKTAYHFVDNTTPPSYVHRTDYLNAASTTESYTYSDGLERAIQSRQPSTSTSMFVVTDRLYNPAGLLASSSLPYFSLGASSTGAIASSTLYINYFYDALQRVGTTSNAAGTTTNAYSKWTTTTKDPNGNLKDYIRDAFGNLSQVVEHSTSTNATTTYTYDAANNLTNITDGASNVRNFTYDGLARRLSAQDLHASADATYGAWTYVYDDADNMTQQTDPKSQVVNRTYDALNRPLTEDYTGLAGTEVTYTYDTCRNGKGSLCTASSTDAKVSNSYDILGRVSVASTTAKGITYTSTSTFDRLGNITSLTNPNAAKEGYVYDVGGHINAVTRTSGGATSTIASSFDYSPMDLVSQIVFGSGASTTMTYNSAALYRLSRILTWGNSATSSIIKLQDLNYGYDPNGNIVTRTDNSGGGGGQQITYVYDPLNRLISAAAGGASLSSQPKAYWKTDESSGNAADATGNGHTLTNLNGVVYSAGKINNAADGGSSNAAKRLEATDNGTYGFTTGAMSMSVWVNVTTAPSSGNLSILFDHLYGNTTSGMEYDLAYDNRSGQPCTAPALTFVRAGSATDIACANVTLSTGTWHHIVGTYDGSTLTLYEDGTSIATHSSTAGGANFGSTGGVATLAAWGGGNYLSGLVDEAGIWSSALTAADVTALYNSGAGVQYPFTGSSGPNYTAQNFSYDVLGNLASKTGQGTYSYSSSGYADPDAVTQIATGLATTTFAYDNNGNLASTTQAATTTQFTYDYANRITQAVVAIAGKATSTSAYGYTYAGDRAFQSVGTSSTTTLAYPSKFYSVASSTSGATTTATTTEYIYAGDRLLATLEQVLLNGVATGTAKTYYAHSDNLGSTDVVSDANMKAVQTLDYYPYGNLRISTNTSPTNERKKFIGQYLDDPTNLNYLNARYYDSSRGQFLSQDPIFLANPKQQDLLNPQDLNSYSYAVDNPITKSDPAGLWYKEFVTGQQSWPSFQLELGQAANQLAQSSPGWNFAFNHPITTGGIVAVGAIPALYSGGSAASAFEMATYPGVGGTFAAQQGFAGLVYSALTAQSTLAIPGLVSAFGQADPSKPFSYFPTAMTMSQHFGPSILGGTFSGYPGAIYDAYQFAGLLNQTLGNAVANLFSNSIQTRVNTTKTFNSATGGSSSGGSPSSGSLWVTPSGAVVTFGGQLVSAPPSSK